MSNTRQAQRDIDNWAMSDRDFYVWRKWFVLWGWAAYNGRYAKQGWAFTRKRAEEAARWAAGAHYSG